MAIFLNEDVVKLLWNKFVVVIGDSIQRSIYKDLVSLLQTNSYLSENSLKKKGEMSFMNDVLIEGGQKEAMNNGINYKEVRQYKTDYHIVRFYFVTKVYNKYMESIFIDLENDPKPDVVMMNSCLWDISRYGSGGMQLYKTNLEKTFTKMRQILEPECLFMWNTALPVANKIRGGFLLPELAFLSETLRLDVLEGNFYAKEIAVVHEFDVLDLHFYFKGQLHRRVADGVHWNHQAHRHISNMILTHISEAWGLSVPRRFEQWQRPATPVNSTTRSDENFHSDITLSAPAKTSHPRRNSTSDDWSSLPHFTDFDSPQQPSANMAHNTNNRPNPQHVTECQQGKQLLPNPLPELLSIPPHERNAWRPSKGTAQCILKHRQARRYNPYGRGNDGGPGCNGGNGREWNNWQAGNQSQAPFWPQTEAGQRPHYDNEWLRQRQYEPHGFQY